MCLLLPSPPSSSQHLLQAFRSETLISLQPKPSHLSHAKYLSLSMSPFMFLCLVSFFLGENQCLVCNLYLSQCMISPFFCLVVSFFLGENQCLVCDLYLSQCMISPFFCLVVNFFLGENQCLVCDLYLSQCMISPFFCEFLGTSVYMDFVVTISRFLQGPCRSTNQTDLSPLTCFLRQ